MRDDARAHATRDRQQWGRGCGDVRAGPGLTMPVMSTSTNRRAPLRHVMACVLAIACTLAGARASLASASASASSTQAPVGTLIDHRVLVAFRDDASPASIERLLGDAGAVQVTVAPGIG